MPFPSGSTRMVEAMYKAFYDMEHTPFVRDIPPGRLYESSMADTIGRLSYVADRQFFAVFTADAGCGNPHCSAGSCLPAKKDKPQMVLQRYAGSVGH